jgi:hypothetical protein
MLLIIIILLAIAFLISLYPTFVQLVVSYYPYKHHLMKRRDVLILFARPLIETMLALFVIFLIIYAAIIIFK